VEPRFCKPANLERRSGLDRSVKGRGPQLVAGAAESPDLRSAMRNSNSDERRKKCLKKAQECLEEIERQPERRSYWLLLAEEWTRRASASLHEDGAGATGADDEQTR
jgi:hypothetical protein